MKKTIKPDTQISEDKLQILLSRKRAAYHVDKEARKRWKKILQVLDFKHDVLVDGTTKTTQVKYPLLWTAYDNYLSLLSTSDPQINITAEGKEDFVKEAFWKGVLEYKKRKIRVDDTREEFIQSFLTCGKAVYKIGQDILIETVEETVKSGENSETVMTRNVDVPTRNKSFVEVIDPRKFWISPESRYKGPLLETEIPYVIEEMVKRPDEVEQRYDVKLDKDELEIIDPFDEMDEDGKSVTKSYTEDTSDDIKRVRMYAYYGIWELNGKLIDNAEVLFTKKRILKQSNFNDKYKMKKKPYIMALNFRRFFRPDARGALDAVIGLDEEYNEHQNKVRTILRRMASPKWAKLTGTKIDEDALLHPDIGVIVEESQPNAFRPLAVNLQGLGDLMSKTSSVETLFQLSTGIVYGSSAIKEAGTATGQSIVEKGADIKMGRMTHLIERAIEERDIMLLQLEQEFSGQTPIDIRISGADIVRKIQDKKKLFSIETQMYQQTAQAEMEGMMQSGEGQDPQMIQEQYMSQNPPPVDEYDRFQISSDGQSISTSYTAEDIEGEFELKVLSQSSNKVNRSVKSQQYLGALDRSVNDPTISRAELWRRFFSIENESDIDSLVTDQAPMQPQGVPAGENESKNPTEASIQRGANQVV